MPTSSHARLISETRLQIWRIAKLLISKKKLPKLQPRLCPQRIPIPASKTSQKFLLKTEYSRKCGKRRTNIFSDGLFLGWWPFMFIPLIYGRHIFIHAQKHLLSVFLHDWPELPTPVLCHTIRCRVSVQYTQAQPLTRSLLYRRMTWDHISHASASYCQLLFQDYFFFSSHCLPVEPL